jgi:hypothetical protein
MPVIARDTIRDAIRDTIIIPMMVICALYLYVQIKAIGQSCTSTALPTPCIFVFFLVAAVQISSSIEPSKVKLGRHH